MASDRLRLEPDTKWEHPALTQARKLAHARKGPPPEPAKPRVSTFPGKPIPPIPGQLTLEEQNTG